MTTFITILIIAIIAAIVLGLLTRRSKPTRNRSAHVAITQGSKTLTPGGIKVYRVPGAKELPPDQLLAIDAGFKLTLEKAKARWPAEARIDGLDESDVTVVIFPSEMRNGIPVYKVESKGSGYAGSEYDQGGFIYVAGQVTDIENHTIALPEHPAEMVEALTTIMAYEMEHVAAYRNDKALYEATKVHGQTGHPIF